MLPWLLACAADPLPKPGSADSAAPATEVVDCHWVDTTITTRAAEAAAAGSGAWWRFASDDELATLDDPALASRCGYLRRHVVDTVAAPNARCNDGSPAIYYTVDGTTDPDRWLVYLKGGSGCFFERACATRWHSEKFGDLMTSSADHHPPISESQLTGLLSNDPGQNPDFAGWSKAWLLYCSSDGWAGSRAGSGPPRDQDAPRPADDDPAIAAMLADGTWHFRGADIVHAVVGELADGPLADATQVVLAGSSAGASGVRNHADRLRAGPLAHVPTVHALLDAGWFGPTVNADPDDVAVRLVDAGHAPDQVDAWRSAGDPVPGLTALGVPPDAVAHLADPDAAAAYALYAGSLRYGIDYTGSAESFDDDCLAATDGDPVAADGRWMCLEPYVAAGFVDTPVFVYMDQGDPVNMNRLFLDLGSDGDHATFAAGVRAMALRADGAFSPRHCTHEAAYHPDIWAGADVPDCDGTPRPLTIADEAYRDAFAAWLADAADPHHVEPP